jgi:tetratricopeptide (TPR) repeat protein
MNMLSPNSHVMAKITATLTGRDEVPPSSTKGEGAFELELTADGGISNFKLSVRDITNVTSVHLHQGANGTNGPAVLTLLTDTNPRGQMNGVLSEGKVYSSLFEGPLVGKYISDLMGLIDEGNVYINLSTSQNPTGEVRGQLFNADNIKVELEEITRYFNRTVSRQDIPYAKYLAILNRLEDLAALKPDKYLQAKICFLIAYCLHSSNIDLRRAIDNYNLSLQNGYDEFWVVYNRGVLHMELGDIEAARNDLDRAASLNPSHQGAKQLREGVFLPSLLDKEKEPMMLASPVIVCCVPRSGTILLRNILRSVLGDNLVIPSNSFSRPLVTSEYLLALPRLTNRAYVGHIRYSEDLAKKLASFPKIVLIRDPRDYVISYAHFMDRLAKETSGPQKEWYENYWTKKEPDEKLSTMIFGLDTRLARKVYPSVFTSYLDYAIKWSGPNTLMLRYEDIISAKLGGNDKTVIKTIRSIMDLLGVQIDEETLAQRIAQGSDPAKSNTFRFGGKGNWKYEFKPHHVTQMKTVGPSLLPALNYEVNEDWDLSITGKKRIPREIKVNPVSLLGNMPVLSMSRYLYIRRELEGKKGIERLIDEWAVDLFIENEQYEDAISILKQLLNQERANPLWNYLYALSLHQVGNDLDKALHHYNYALENGYDEFWIRYNRGLLLLTMGYRDEAIIDLETASRLKPEHKAVHETLASMKIPVTARIEPAQ